MSSPAVRLYTWIKSTKPTYFYDGCKISFRYAEIITTTVRNSPVKVMIEFDTSVAFIDPPKSFAIHLVNEWIDKTGIYLVLFYAYSNSRNRYTMVVTARNAPKPSRHHRSKGLKVPKSEERITFVSMSASSSTISDELQSKTSDIDNSNGSENVTTLNADTESNYSSETLSENVEFIEVKKKKKENLKAKTFNGRKYFEPVLMTSKAVQSDVSISLPISPESPKREERKILVPRRTYANVTRSSMIPLNYNSDEFSDKIAMSYLSRNDVFERVRLQLAFFRHEKDVNVNLMSYVSNKMFLINSGVAAHNDEHLERLYFKFCEEKGLKSEEISRDLKNTEYAIRTKRLNYLTAAKRNFFEFYSTDYSRSKVIVKSPHILQDGRCDPETCMLM